MGTDAGSHVTAWQALKRAPWRYLTSWWPWRALAYLLVSAVIGVVLVPLIVLTLLFVPLWGIVIGAIERRRTRILGFPRQASGHVRVGPERRRNWLGIRLTEAATWREAAALLVDLVMGWISLAIIVAETVTVAAPVVMAIRASRTATDFNFAGDIHWYLTPQTWWTVIPVVVVALCVFGYLNTIVAAGHATLLRALLTPRQTELERNVERLTRSRAALVTAFEAERRRIERDLHDGVQQELVTLAARLGLASLELDELERTGSATAELRTALESAQAQAEHAMATLRNTVRGIHPAILTDHGLAAALAELADRTAVPIALELGNLRRAPAAAETAAYYLVTEAITNAAKHTTATRIRVEARSGEGTLTVTVTDNGHGGADEDRGTGLRGLRERAETLGGTLAVTSPVGGPTTLRMSLPVADAALGSATDAATDPAADIGTDAGADPAADASPAKGSAADASPAKGSDADASAHR